MNFPFLPLPVCPPPLFLFSSSYSLETQTQTWTFNIYVCHITSFTTWTWNVGFNSRETNISLLFSKNFSFCVCFSQTSRRWWLNKTSLLLTSFVHVFHLLLLQHIHVVRLERLWLFFLVTFRVRWFTCRVNMQRRSVFADSQRDIKLRNEPQHESEDMQKYERICWMPNMPSSRWYNNWKCTNHITVAFLGGKFS